MKILFKKSLLMLCCFTLLQACSSSNELTISESLVAKNVLFIGNSQTFWNGGVDIDIQGFVNQLDVTDKIFIDKIALPAYTLKEHWNDQATKNKIDSRQWNAIILQENANIAAYDYDQMAEYAKNFVDLINAKGASTYFYMTWSEDNDFDVTALIEDSYLKVGEANNAPVIKGGTAFEAFFKENQIIDLYDPDRNHPSKEGTFLIAALSYKLIYKKDPADNTYIGNLTAADAQTIKEFASTFR